MTEPLLIARNAATDLHLLPQMANRHGLITGATGTGKTVTLQTLAEHFSSIGVPCFMSDVKGDLSGISQPGGGNAKVAERVDMLKLEGFEHQGYPVTLWDPFGEAGHPVRATVSDMGPLLLGRMLDLNDTQSGVLNLVFKVADDNGLLLLDLKDLRTMLAFVGDNARQFTTEYGNVSSAVDRRHPARPAGAGIAGRRADLRRADAQHRRPDPDRPRSRRHQHPGRRPADAVAEDVRDAAAVAAGRTVREPARGGRPRQAETGVLLRRSAPAVHRRARCAGGKDRAGGAADPLQRGRRVFRHPEPGRRAGQGAVAARQPGAACAARVLAARPESRQGRRRNHARQSGRWTRRPSSPNSASARRWCPSSTTRAAPAWSSAPSSCRRRARSAPSPTLSAGS